MGRGSRKHSTTKPTAKHEKWVRKQKEPLGQLWDSWTQQIWQSERKAFMRDVAGISKKTRKSWMYAHGLRDKPPKKLHPASPEEEQILSRILSYSEDRNLDFKEVFLSAARDEVVASALQKNPTKQNTYEALAAAWAEEKSGVPTFQLSSQSSRLELRFKEDGTPVVGGKASDSDSKSADIISLISNGDELVAIISAHKFARVGGGHQDNQRKDAEHFLKYAQRAEEIPELQELAFSLAGEHKKFSWQPALILDGAYFQKHIEDLQKKFPDSFIGNSDLYVDFLRGISS